MSILEINYIPNKTTIFFSKMNKVLSYVGLPNIWIDDENDNKIKQYFHRIITLWLVFFLLMEFGAFFTQSHLTEKQSNDHLLFSFSHTVLFSYYISLEYHRETIKKLLIMLCITLKDRYNDLDVEMKMIRKASFYSGIFILSCCGSLVFYGFNGLMQVLHSGGAFITVITAWPDVEEKSSRANYMRVLSYLSWWTFMARVLSVLTLLIMTTVLLSHQYKNLQSYFYSLNDLFQKDCDGVEHRENELKYVEALKVGIKLHSDTLRCTEQWQVTSSLAYSGQIFINIFVLCLLMLQMVNSERTFVNVLTIIFSGIATLGCFSFIMWNAGDVTFEAALIPTAMYSSGWENCRGTISKTVRNLLVTAMIQGQEHVVLRSFKVVEISYESYLSIVKLSYTAFSLLYNTHK